MADGKKTVVVYTNWITTFEKLSDEEAGMLIKHLFRYINDLNPVAPNRLIELVFEPFKQILKTDLMKYEEIKEKRRAAGLLGGAPKGNKNAGKQSKTSKTTKRLKKQAKQPDTDNDTVTDTVTDTVLSNDNNNKILSGETPVMKLHTRCKNYFHEKYEELFGETYYWEGKDGANLNPIIKKIKFNRENKNLPVDDDSLLQAFMAFIESITDEWILKNFSIPNINSKFNEIVSQAKIKNGTKKTESNIVDI